MNGDDRVQLTIAMTFLISLGLAVAAGIGYLVWMMSSEPWFWFVPAGLAVVVWISWKVVPRLDE